jgi:hypothetical protein
MSSSHGACTGNEIMDSLTDIRQGDGRADARTWQRNVRVKTISHRLTITIGISIKQTKFTSSDDINGNSLTIDKTGSAGIKGKVWHLPLSS